MAPCAARLKRPFTFNFATARLDRRRNLVSRCGIRNGIAAGGGSCVAPNDNNVQETTMSDRHVAFWPKGLPRHLSVPRTNLFYNLEVSAARYPDKTALVF